MIERLRTRHSELFEDVVVRAADEYSRFFYSYIVNKFKILFFRTYPRCDFRKFHTESHTSFNGFSVFFCIYEKLALTDQPVFSAES